MLTSNLCDVPRNHYRGLRSSTASLLLSKAVRLVLAEDAERILRLEMQENRRIFFVHLSSRHNLFQFMYITVLLLTGFINLGFAPRIEYYSYDTWGFFIPATIILLFVLCNTGLVVYRASILRWETHGRIFDNLLEWERANNLYEQISPLPGSYVESSVGGHTTAKKPRVILSDGIVVSYDPANWTSIPVAEGRATSSCLVYRDEKWFRIPILLLVPGDLISLMEGETCTVDKLPIDSHSIGTRGGIVGHATSTGAAYAESPATPALPQSSMGVPISSQSMVSPDPSRLSINSPAHLLTPSNINGGKSSISKASSDKRLRYRASTSFDTPPLLKQTLTHRKSEHDVLVSDDGRNTTPNGTNMLQDAHDTNYLDLPNKEVTSIMHSASASVLSSGGERIPNGIAAPVPSTASQSISPASNTSPDQTPRLLSTKERTLIAQARSVDVDTVTLVGDSRRYIVQKAPIIKHLKRSLVPPVRPQPLIYTCLRSLLHLLDWVQFILMWVTLAFAIVRYIITSYFDPYIMLPESAMNNGAILEQGTRKLEHSHIFSLSRYTIAQALSAAFPLSPLMLPLMLVIFEAIGTSIILSRQESSLVRNQWKDWMKSVMARDDNQISGSRIHEEVGTIPVLDGKTSRHWWFYRFLSLNIWRSLFQYCNRLIRTSLPIGTFYFILNKDWIIKWNPSDSVHTVRSDLHASGINRPQKELQLGNEVTASGSDEPGQSASLYMTVGHGATSTDDNFGSEYSLQEISASNEEVSKDKETPSASPSADLEKPNDFLNDFLEKISDNEYVSTLLSHLCPSRQNDASIEYDIDTSESEWDSSDSHDEDGPTLAGDQFHPEKLPGTKLSVLLKHWNPDTSSLRRDIGAILLDSAIVPAQYVRNTRSRRICQSIRDRRKREEGKRDKMSRDELPDPLPWDVPQWNALPQKSKAPQLPVQRSPIVWAIRNLAYRVVQSTFGKDLTRQIFDSVTSRQALRRVFGGLRFSSILTSRPNLTLRSLYYTIEFLKCKPTRLPDAQSYLLPGSEVQQRFRWSNRILQRELVDTGFGLPPQALPAISSLLPFRLGCVSVFCASDKSVVCDAHPSVEQVMVLSRTDNKYLSVIPADSSPNGISFVEGGWRQLHNHLKPLGLACLFGGGMGDTDDEEDEEENGSDFLNRHIPTPHKLIPKKAAGQLHSKHSHHSSSNSQAPVKAKRHSVTWATRERIFGSNLQETGSIASVQTNTDVFVHEEIVIAPNLEITPQEPTLRDNSGDHTVPTILTDTSREVGNDTMVLKSPTNKLTSSSPQTHVTKEVHFAELQDNRDDMRQDELLKSSQAAVEPNRDKISGLEGRRDDNNTEGGGVRHDKLKPQSSRDLEMQVDTRAWGNTGDNNSKKDSPSSGSRTRTGLTKIDPFGVEETMSVRSMDERSEYSYFSEDLREKNLLLRSPASHKVLQYKEEEDTDTMHSTSGETFDSRDGCSDEESDEDGELSENGTKGRWEWLWKAEQEHSNTFDDGLLGSLQALEDSNSSSPLTSSELDSDDSSSDSSFPNHYYSTSDSSYESSQRGRRRRRSRHSFIDESSGFSDSPSDDYYRIAYRKKKYLSRYGYSSSSYSESALSTSEEESGTSDKSSETSTIISSDTTLITSDSSHSLVRKYAKRYRYPRRRVKRKQKRKSEKKKPTKKAESEVDQMPVTPIVLGPESKATFIGVNDVEDWVAQLTPRSVHDHMSTPAIQRIAEDELFQLSPTQTVPLRRFDALSVYTSPSPLNLEKRQISNIRGSPQIPKPISRGDFVGLLSPQPVPRLFNTKFRIMSGTSSCYHLIHSSITDLEDIFLASKRSISGLGSPWIQNTTGAAQLTPISSEEVRLNPNLLFPTDPRSWDSFDKYRNSVTLAKYRLSNYVYHSYFAGDLIIMEKYAGKRWIPPASSSDSVYDGLGSPFSTRFVRSAARPKAMRSRSHDVTENRTVTISTSASSEPVSPRPLRASIVDLDQNFASIASSTSIPSTVIFNRLLSQSNDEISTAEHYKLLRYDPTAYSALISEVQTEEARSLHRLAQTLVQIPHRKYLVPLVREMGFTHADRAVFTKIRTVHAIICRSQNAFTSGVHRTLTEGNLPLTFSTPLRSLRAPYSVLRPLLSSSIFKDSRSNRYHLSTIGTVPYVLPNCDLLWDGKDLIPLNPERRKLLVDRFQEWKGGGLEVLGLAYDTLSSAEGKSIQAIDAAWEEYKRYLKDIRQRRCTCRSTGKQIVAQDTAHEMITRKADCVCSLLHAMGLSFDVFNMEMPPFSVGLGFDGKDIRLIERDKKLQVLLNARHALMAHAANSKSIQTPEYNLLRMLSGQVFVGMVASRRQPQYRTQSLVRQLHNHGVRFVYTSEKSYRVTQPLALKMGLETGWNCAISLQPRKRRPRVTKDKEGRILEEDVVRRTEAQILFEIEEEEEDFGVEGVLGEEAIRKRVREKLDVHDWDHKAKLPHGLPEIRYHIRHTDNVPLQVSLFTDSQPESTAGVMRIQQEFGETPMVITSSLRPSSTLLLGVADVGIALEPKTVPTRAILVQDTVENMNEPMDNDTDEEVEGQGSLDDKPMPLPLPLTHPDLRFASALFSLPAAITLPADTALHTLRATLSESRRWFWCSLAAIAFYAFAQTAIGLILSLHSILPLPPIFSPNSTLWLTIVIIPILSLSILASPSMPGDLKSENGSSATPLLPLSRLGNPLGTLWDVLPGPEVRTPSDGDDEVEQTKGKLQTENIPGFDPKTGGIFAESLIRFAPRIDPLATVSGCLLELDPTFVDMPIADRSRNYQGTLVSEKEKEKEDMPREWKTMVGFSTLVLLPSALGFLILFFRTFHTSIYRFCGNQTFIMEWNIVPKFHFANIDTFDSKCLQKAEATSQASILFTFVIWSVALSSLFIFRTHPPWKRPYPISNKIWAVSTIAVLVVQLIHSWWLTYGASAPFFIYSVPWDTWFLSVIVVTIGFILGIIIKLKDIKKWLYNMKRLKLQFDTRLGMHSPR